MNFAKFLRTPLLQSRVCDVQSSRETASINITTLVKLILFSSTCSVQLTCQVFSCEFCEVCKNTYSHRTPSVAASE